MLAFQLYAYAFCSCAYVLLFPQKRIFFDVVFLLRTDAASLRFLRVSISASTFDNTRYHSCFMRMHCFYCASVLLFLRLHHFCDFCVPTSARFVISVMFACFDSNNNVFKLMSMSNHYAHAWFFLRIRCFDLAYSYVYWSLIVKFWRMSVFNLTHTFVCKCFCLF